MEMLKGAKGTLTAFAEILERTALGCCMSCCAARNMTHLLSRISRRILLKPSLEGSAHATHVLSITLQQPSSESCPPIPRSACKHKMQCVATGTFHVT